MPTFGGPGSPQVVDGPQDEPQGLLLVAGDAQHLHCGLQFGKLLRRSLLVLGLRGNESICSNLSYVIPCWFTCLLVI